MDKYLAEKQLDTTTAPVGHVYSRDRDSSKDATEFYANSPPTTANRIDTINSEDIIGTIDEKFDYFKKALRDQKGVFVKQLIDLGDAIMQSQDVIQGLKQELE